MKKIYLFSILLIMFSFISRADKEKLFTYNEEKVSSELQQLNELENYVNQNEGVTLSELKEADNSLANNVTYNPVVSITMRGEPPLGIPSFIWGCVLGGLGIILVYVLSEDKDETKKALWGCLVSGGVYLIVYIIFWVIIGTSATVY